LTLEYQRENQNETPHNPLIFMTGRVTKFDGLLFLIVELLSEWLTRRRVGEMIAL